MEIFDNLKTTKFWNTIIDVLKLFRRTSISFEMNEPWRRKVQNKLRIVESWGFKYKTKQDK